MLFEACSGRRHLSPLFFGWPNFTSLTLIAVFVWASTANHLHLNVNIESKLFINSGYLLPLLFLLAPALLIPSDYFDKIFNLAKKDLFLTLAEPGQVFADPLQTAHVQVYCLLRQRVELVWRGTGARCLRLQANQLRDNFEAKNRAWGVLAGVETI